MNDFKHGQGQLLDESGVYDGLWENDMVSACWLVSLLY